MNYKFYEELTEKLVKIVLKTSKNQSLLQNMSNQFLCREFH